jgi:hypothetical protein
MSKFIFATVMTLFTASTLAFSEIDAIKTAEGLMMAFSEDLKLSGIMTCIHDVEILEKEMMDAVSDFERKDFEGIVHGLEEVMLIVHALPQDIKDCSTITGNVEQLEKWAEIFAKPLSLYEHLAKNVAMHFYTIHNDVMEALKDYHNQDYYDFGLNIGKTLILAIGSFGLDDLAKH